MVSGGEESGEHGEDEVEDAEGDRGEEGEEGDYELCGEEVEGSAEGGLQGSSDLGAAIFSRLSLLLELSRFPPQQCSRMRFSK